MAMPMPMPMPSIVSLFFGKKKEYQGKQKRGVTQVKKRETRKTRISKIVYFVVYFVVELLYRSLWSK